jgi:N utilization substance protein B
MLKGREKVRGSAFIVLFQYACTNASLADIYASSEMSQTIELSSMVKELAEGTVKHWVEFDEIIAKHSPTRAVTRISTLLLTIIKLALYEMLYDKRTPVNSAISEAVKLADCYGYDEDVAFVNGVLGSIAGTLK